MFAKLLMVAIIAIAGVFANANLVQADYATPACNTATLNGAVNPNGAITTVWFEWGPGSSLSYSTPKQTFTTSGTFSQKISGLQENSSYSFQAVAQNSFGTSYGSVISFTTQNCTTVPAPTVNISADSTNLSYNGSTTINWYSNSANSCSGSGGANGWVGNKSLISSFYTGNLTQTTTFTITCINSTGKGSDSVTINVASAPVQNPTVSISASPSSVAYNGSSTLSWNSANTASCTGTGGANGWSGNKSLSGNTSTGNLTNTTTFSITCTSSSGQQVSDSVTVTVGNAPVQNPTVSITANPSSVNYNSASTLSWNSANANSCNGTGGTNGWSGAKSLSNSFYTGNLTNNTTFTITCTSSSGQQVSDSVTVTVGNAPVNSPTVSITADNSNIPYNGSTTIRWSSNNATSCSASGGSNGWSGNKALSGSASTGTLTTDQIYNITCTNSSGSASDSVFVNVGNAPVISAPTVNISSDSSNVAYNGSTTIRWNSSNATSCSASGGTNGWSGSKALLGSFYTGNLTNAVTFHINCSNSSGSDNASVTVSVGSQQVQAPSVSIFASPSNINYNGTSVISWTSTDATSCNASGGMNGWSGSKALFGNFNTGALTNNVTYNITCSNSSGSDNATVTVIVGGQQISQPSVTIYADDNDIDEDDSTTVRWTSNNADSCSATGGANGWSGNKALSGSFYTGSLSSDRTFNITCSNAQGSDSDSVTINVDEDNGSSGDISVDITADDTSIDEGDNVKLRWDSDNADDCETIGGTSDWNRKNIGTSGTFTTEDLDDDETFKIECTNDDGDSDTDSVTVRVSGNSNNNDDRPTVDLTVDRSVVNSGQSTTVRWDVEDADDCYASGGTNGWSGNKNHSSGSFSTGAMYGSATFFLDCGNDEGNESDSVTVQVVSTPVVQPPQTIYIPSPAPAPIVRNTTTYINTGSGVSKPLVELTIDGGDDSIGVGEERIYSVEWKNISGQTLTKVALRITLPESMTFENTNRGSYTAKDNTITLDIDELRPSETGDMLFTARTKSTLRNNQLVVVVANMVYTDNSDRQGDVVAYATHHVDLGGSVLGANVFGTGFFPDTLLGWLFFLLLLLLLLLLIRYLYGKPEQRHVVVDAGHH